MSYTTLRLLLADQLNATHSWFETTDSTVLYVMMEIRPESEYVTHHIQKIVGLFAAMRRFAAPLEAEGHAVRYFHITDADNQHSFADNLNALIAAHHITQLDYQLPDEYRLDQLFKNYCASLAIKTQACDTEHFYTQREDLTAFFKGKKTTIMENFYRHMRKKHGVLMDGKDPLGGQWNYDKQNRKKLPAKATVPAPFIFDHDVTEVYAQVLEADLPHFGNIDPQHFVWPLTRADALAALKDFIDHRLHHFGTYQDAMDQRYWTLYHSLLSFAINTKLLHPKEAVEAVEQAYYNRSDLDLAQVEGFIRQILGWREFIRGMYWREMPEYRDLNFFKAQQDLPHYYWDGDTKMNCMRHAIQQSLDHAYAHHIQRLMVTGNFALLAGIAPDAVDAWYLGVYIDAYEWVELPNTRGMSQFADGGKIATKPYVSSANYIDKMSNYCKNCHYNKKARVGEGACPFNSLYWNFIDQHRERLQSNRRMSMIYAVWNKMDPKDKREILEQAAAYLDGVEAL